MFSVAEESFGLAVRELRDEFGKRLDVERMGPDVGVIATRTPEVGEVAAACARRPLVFIRHLTVELARFPPAEATSIDAVVDVARSVVVGSLVGARLAVQTWVSGSANVGYGSGELFRHLAQDLSKHGLSTRATWTDESPPTPVCSMLVPQPVSSSAPPACASISRSTTCAWTR